MNAKSTAVLALLASAAGLWYFKGDAWGPAVGIKPAHHEPAKSAAESQLDGLTSAAINHVEIVFPSGEPLVLDRAASDSGWKLPGNWPLRKPEVEELVETLGSLRSRFQAIPAETTELTKYGLATDQKPVVVKLTTGKQVLTLTFGEPKLAANETAFTRAAYVRVNDAPDILKLGPDVMPVVRRPADSYKRRTLFPDIERVKVASSGFASPVGAAVISLPGPDTVSIRVARTPPQIWNLDLSPGFTYTLIRTGKLPEPAATNKGDDPSVPQDRLADEWALESPARARAEPAQLRSVLAATADLWVDSFAGAEAQDVRLAAARALPTMFDSFAGLARFAPVSVDIRTGLIGATESLSVTRKNGEPVTIRFGGIAKVAEREEMISVPGGPPGSPPRMIPNKVLTSYRFARLDGNPQVFVVPAEKLPDLFVATNALVDSQVARFNRDEVREIVLRPNGHPEIKLALTKGNPKAMKAEEKESRWFIDAKPNPILADTARVNELLDQLSGFRAGEPDRTLYPAEPSKPTARITIITRDKRPEGEPDGPAHELTLLVGTPNYAKRQLPVQLVGWPRVALVDNNLDPNDSNSWVATLLFPNTISDLIDRPVISYRNRKLFDAAAELAAVSVAGQFTLKRDPDEWKLTAPIASGADPGKAGELANSLSGLSATDYLSAKPTAQDLASYGLATPAHRVRLDFKGGRSYTLELGAARPGKSEVFARLDQGAVFGLPSSVVDQLTTGVAGLLPLKVWSATPDKITAIEITRTDRPAESYKLSRANSNWNLSGPFTAPVPFSNAQPLLATLGNLTAVKYQSLSSANAAEFGFDKPLLKVKLAHTEKQTGATGETPVATTVVIGGPTPDLAGRYARLDRPNAPVFVAPAAFIAAAGTPPLELLDRTLLSLDPTRLVSVRVAPVNATDSFTLSKNAAGKWAAEGISFAVDAERIGRLTMAATNPPVMKLVTYGDAVNWADYGLDKPELTIAITLSGKKPDMHTIALGKTDPLGGRYVRVDNGKAVALLPTSAADALARKKLEYADRTLLSFDPTTLVGLTRKQGKDVLELAPSAALGWDIIQPAKSKADQPFVDELADSLGRMRAESVAAYGKKEQVFKQYGLEPPAATIALTVGDKAEQKTLRIGNLVNASARNGDRYAAVETSNTEAIVGILPAAIVRKLLAPPVAFRDHTLARFVDADKAALERGDRKITFAKVGVSWKVIEPLAAAAESAELEALVADFGKLRADTWVAEKKGADLTSFGLDRPTAKWTLLNGDQPVLVLSLGIKTPEGKVYATTDKSDLVGLLDAQLSARSLAEYRQRKPWQVDAAQASEIMMATKAGTFSLEKAGALWRDPARPADSMDAAAVNELLSTLSVLSVERYAIDRGANFKLFGLEKPETTLTLTSAGAKHVLEIGGMVGGSDGKQRYARIVEKDRDDVFVLSPTDTARLTRDRSQFLMKKNP